jgi:hypothetical protein
MGHELVLAGPYFSFPVIPPPTIAPIVWLHAVIKAVLGGGENQPN